MITLKKLKADDWTLFAKWWRDEELIKMTSGDHTPLTDEDIQQRVGEMAVDEKSHHWLIYLDEVPIGHINLNKIDKSSAELQIVIGEKIHWGKGFGAEAINQVLEEAKKLNYQKILAEVRPENNRAIRLYEKVGFKNSGTKKYDNPNLPEVIILEKEL